MTKLRSVMRIGLLACILLIAGCAAQQAFDRGRNLVGAGHFEEGLASIRKASELDPQNLQYQSYYVKERDLAVRRLLVQAQRARLRGRGTQAEVIYHRALDIDPLNVQAKAGLDALATEKQHQDLLRDAKLLLKDGSVEEARKKIRAVLADDPSNKAALALSRRIDHSESHSSITGKKLAAALEKPITLEFRNAPLQSVFELISRNVGLNFIFDKDVRPNLKTTIFVRNTSIDDVIRFILVTNQLRRKVLNDNTLLIYPDTEAKVKKYQDLVVKSFYLVNADAKQTADMIQTLLKTRDVFVDEKRNLVTIRDTPQVVRMAEKLVAAEDLAEPEVMLELEVMEVGRDALTELGIRYPSQVSFSMVGKANTPGTIGLDEWLNRNSGLYRISVTDPALILNLQDQESSADVLANPRIRVKNHETAKIHIGDKVPVITTTSTATGFISESVSYLDVGLKLEVQPTIYLDNEVGIKVGLEVSNIVQEIKSASGTLTYRLGTRNASTVLRLKDGETQILAGLINDEDRRTADKVPGLSNLPIVGRLFSNRQDTSTKTEIVLLITPHIVRNLTPPGKEVEEFDSGTEASIGAAPLKLKPVAAKSSQPHAGFKVPKIPTAPVKRSSN